MKFYFYTLGCKVNQYESQTVAELLEKKGCTAASCSDEADIIIVNSCTVTAEGDRKTRQTVRRFKRENQKAVLVLMGCMPQAFPETAKMLPEADVVTGNSGHEKIPDMIERYIKTGERVIEILPHEKGEKYSTPALCRFSQRTRAFMKIEDGCERYCTYCTIPKARGVVRSRDIADIKAEANALANSGYKEIVLVGINLTSFGKDTGAHLCDAVAAAASPEGIKRIRLGSLEPDHISDETLEKLRCIPEFCPQFHLALQSGCDETLKRMNRRYDTAFYRDLVGRIRAKFENCSITTDIMVGFPGESEEEFQKSLAFYREIGFARGHVFAYSKREGTVAAALKNQVDEPVKNLRARKMLRAAEDCERAFIKGQIGKTASVLFETYKNGVNEGYTENYTRVVLNGSDLSGEIVTMELTEGNLL